MSVDLHLHTTASDGTESPSEVVKLAYGRGINIIAVTDHDTVAGLAEARASLPEGMTLIDGIEMSCAVRGEGGFRCHILGYGIDPRSPYIAGAIEAGRVKRMAKLGRRLEYLRESFGIELSEVELERLYSHNSPSRLHIARLLTERGLTRNNDEAIEKYLDAGRMPDDRIDADMAISAIKRAGGVPIFAHPLGGEGDVHLDEGELVRRVLRLLSLGVMGLEGYYSRYTSVETALLCRVAREMGLLISAGSDYHGGNKTVVLGSLGAEGAEPDLGKITVLSKLIK